MSVTCKIVHDDVVGLFVKKITLGFGGAHVPFGPAPDATLVMAAKSWVVWR